MVFDRYSDLIDAFLRPALARGTWPEIQEAVETILGRARRRMTVAGIPEDQLDRALVTLRAHLDAVIRDHAMPADEKAPEAAPEEPRAVLIDAEAITAALSGLSTSLDGTEQRRLARMNLSHEGFDRAQIDAADDALRAAIRMRSTEQKAAPEPQQTSKPKPEPKAKTPEQQTSSAEAKRPNALARLATALETRLPDAFRARLGQGAGGKVIAGAAVVALAVVGISVVGGDRAPSYTASSGLTLSGSRTPSAPKPAKAEKWVALHRYSGMYDPDIAVGDTVDLYYGHLMTVLDVYESAAQHRVVLYSRPPQCSVLEPGSGIESRIVTPRAVKVELTGDELEIGYDRPEDAIAATSRARSLSATPDSPIYESKVWVMSGDMTANQWLYMEVSPEQEGAFRHAYDGCYPL